MNHSYSDRYSVQEIVNLYLQGNSIETVRQIYGGSSTLIQNIIKSEGIELRKRVKHSIDDKYFDNIDTPDKAYILGLLYADGYNSIEKRYRFCINLQEKDKDLLEKIKQRLKYTGPLSKWNKKLPRQDQYALSFSNERVSLKLYDLGVRPGKSFTLNYPHFLEYHLQIHFLRGFFDGDGWISGNDKKKSVVIGWIGTTEMCEGISKFIEKLTGYTPLVRSYKKGKYSVNNIKYINITQKKISEFLMSLWYKDTDLYMERKYKKYKEFFIDKRYHLFFEEHKNDVGRAKTRVCMFDIDGNFIKEFSSIQNAGRETGIYWESIMDTCLKVAQGKKLRKSGRTCLWAYKKDYEKGILPEIHNEKTQIRGNLQRILQLDLNDNIIKEWSCATETKEKGFDNSQVGKCCKSIKNTYKGFKWKYK